MQKRCKLKKDNSRFPSWKLNKCTTFWFIFTSLLCIFHQTRIPCSQLWHRHELLWVTACFPVSDHTERKSVTLDIFRRLQRSFSKHLWKCALLCLGLTVVTGWLHVDVSRSRMWMWLFQPRPGLSPCGSSPTCYIRAHNKNCKSLSSENRSQNYSWHVKQIDGSVFMRTGLLTPNEDNSSYS